MAYPKININPLLYNQKEITSPEMIYILGLAWADGSVTFDTKTSRYMLRIQMVEEDISSINFIFEQTGKWKHCLMKQKIGKMQKCYWVCDKLFVDFLIKCDYKSKNDCSIILNKIPKDLKYLWWRGYSDGDGSFSIRTKTSGHFNYSGPIDENWEECEKLMNNLNIEYKILRCIYKNGFGSSSIRISKTEECKKWGEYLYQDKINIGLKRKYNKFLYLKINGKGKRTSQKYTWVKKINNKWGFVFEHKSIRYVKTGFENEDEAYSDCLYHRRLIIGDKKQDVIIDYQLKSPKTKNKLKRVNL